jgi:hypothetical protein
MLIDHLLPHCDFSERHEIDIRATPERVYDAVRTAELAKNPVVKLLLGLRGMRRPGHTAFPPPGFHLLGDDRPREVVLGLEGPFWKPNCKLREDVSRETFATAVPANTARAAWNFFIEPNGATTRLVTETRVLCGDAARKRFRAYWTFIRPFSGLIRILMLRAIRDEAERG